MLTRTAPLLRRCCLNHSTRAWDNLSARGSAARLAQQQQHTRPRRRQPSAAMATDGEKAVPGTFEAGYNIAKDQWYTELSSMWPGA